MNIETGTLNYVEGFNGNVIDVAVTDGVLYMGGHFSDYCGPIPGSNFVCAGLPGSASRDKLAAVDRPPVRRCPHGIPRSIRRSGSRRSPPAVTASQSEASSPGWLASTSSTSPGSQSKTIGSANGDWRLALPVPVAFLGPASSMWVLVDPPHAGGRNPGRLFSSKLVHGVVQLQHHLPGVVLAFARQCPPAIVRSRCHRRGGLDRASQIAERDNNFRPPRPTDTCRASATSDRASVADSPVPATRCSKAS